MKYLVVTLRTPEFDPQIRPAHYRFLDDLRSRGQLEQAGPFTDMSGGAYVLRAGSLAEAVQISQQDPLHLERCSTITVHEWDAI